MNRREARIISFKCIYQLIFDENLDINTLIENTNETGKEIIDYVYTSVTGVKNNLEEIDKIISSNLKKWTINRIAKIDLAILRLAIYEIKHIENIPYKVSANEAVEIAKEYGNNESSKFINGVLASVIKSIEG